MHREFGQWKGTVVLDFLELSHSSNVIKLIVARWIMSSKRGNQQCIHIYFAYFRTSTHVASIYLRTPELILTRMLYFKNEFLFDRSPKYLSVTKLNSHGNRSDLVQNIVI